MGFKLFLACYIIIMSFFTLEAIFCTKWDRESINEFNKRKKK